MSTTVARLRALMAKATPGPWYHSGRYADQSYLHPVDRKSYGCLAAFHAGAEKDEANAQLAAEAMSALPTLLAVAEAAEVVNRQVWDGAEPKDAYAADCALSEALEGLNNHYKESK